MDMSCVLSFTGLFEFYGWVGEMFSGRFSSVARSCLLFAYKSKRTVARGAT